MGYLLRIFNMAALAALIFVMPPAHAQAGALQPWPVSLNYQFYYLEIPIGSLQLKVNQAAQQAQMQAQTRVSGVAQLFSDHQSHASLAAQGAIPAEAARRYETRYSGRHGEQRRIVLNYEAGGAFSDAVRENIHDMARREPVSPAQLSAAYDPLSGLWMVRQQLHAALAAGKQGVAMQIYDGKRLYQLDFTLLGDAQLQWRGAVVPVQKIAMKQRVIAGSTEKERKRIAAYQLPPALLYFTQDEQFLPVLLQQDWKLGSFKAVLQ